MRRPSCGSHAGVPRARGRNPNAELSPPPGWHTLMCSGAMTQGSRGSEGQAPAPSRTLALPTPPGSPGEIPVPAACPDPCRHQGQVEAGRGGWTRGHRLSQPVSSPRGQLAQGAPGGLSATCLRKGLPSGYVRGQGAGLVGLEPPVDKPRQEPTPRAGRDLQQALDQPPSAVTSPALPWGLPCRGQEGLGRTGLLSAEASGRKRRPGGSGVGPPGRPRGGAGWAP